MKKFILFLVSLSIAGLVSAQITVTNATFPTTGDTLRTATDINPSSIEITAAGGPYDWDYSSLSVGPQNVSVFLEASEGSVAADLPTATHVVIDDMTGTETYYRVSNDQVELLAANGNDPTGFGINSIFEFNPPILQRRAPMMFIDNNMTEANLSIALAWSDLPPILTDSLPLPITPDSIRVRIVNTRNDLVDAYGTLTIPGGSYEVLREKRTVYTDTRVEAKVPILGWQDVTDLLGGFGGGGLGQDTTITYDFYSNTEKEPIAVVTADENDNVTSVTFKDNGTVTSDDEVLVEKPAIALLPNPVVNTAGFRFKNFPQGNYSLNIYGSYGQLILQKKINILGNHSERIDLSHMPAANYFYLIKNEMGKNMTSGKLIKL